MPRLPLVVVTGFLGSGKTTLVNHVLSNTLGLRVAVLVNELGDIDIDSQLIDAAASVTGDLVQLKNGCICCTVSDDLEAAIVRLLDSRPAGTFDYLLLETTGVADPAPIVYTVEKSEELKRRCFVEAVVTVVNADLFVNSDVVEPTVAAQSQLRNGDLIVVNKCDLVSKSELASLVARLGTEYHKTAVLTSSFGEVSVGSILHPPDESKSAAPAEGSGDTPSDAGAGAGAGAAGDSGTHAGHSHEHDHAGSRCEERHTHAHGRATSDHLAKDGFTSAAFASPAPLVAWKFAAFLRRLPKEALRAKGIVQLSGASDNHVLVMHKSGQRYTLQCSAGEPPSPAVQLVVIGTGLDCEALTAEMGACVATGDRERESSVSGAGGPTAEPDESSGGTAKPSGDGEAASTGAAPERATALADAGDRPRESGAGAGGGIASGEGGERGGRKLEAAAEAAAGAGESATSSPRRCFAELHKLVDADHRMWWRKVAEGVASFGLTGIVGFGMQVDAERRSELNRELIQRVNMSGSAILLPVQVVDPVGETAVVALVDCRGDDLDVAALWRVVEREAIPVLTQAFAEAMCC